ncbi:alpha/beta hydrolase fold family protein [Bordetella holmesii 70147]|nr:alpha/beta hydrolase fold family protein [Bordetella holmesii 70147]
MSRQENPLPQALTDDGVRLSYASLGEGPAVLFVHEFAGDMRSWEPQLRAFARRHRCIVFNARGYPPSDVPEAADAYSQARAVRDMAAVLDDAGVEQAHIVGLSMGGFATLHFGLAFPERARSLTIAGAGYGAMGRTGRRFRRLRRQQPRNSRRLAVRSMAPCTHGGLPVYRFWTRMPAAGRSSPMRWPNTTPVALP